MVARGKVNDVLVSDLVDWFKGEFGALTCSEIVGGDPFARLTRCPGIVAATYREARSILNAHGVLTGPA